MPAEDLYKEIIDSPILVYPPINPSSDKADEQKKLRIKYNLTKTQSSPRNAILYLHIPFCLTRCRYCTYNSSIAREGEPIISEYLEALLREMSQYSVQPYVRGLRMITAFIGGGSPSLLSSNQLEHLLKKMRQCFDLDGLEEFTIEFELRTITEEKIKICREHGVSRISFGWQTFAPNVRKICGIRPTEDILKEKISLLTKYNFSLNTDMMYGLPEQTFTDWKKDIDQALGFGFTGLDLYKCEIVPPAPLFALSKVKHWKMAGKQEKKDMFRYASDYLQSEGFVQDSYQHFYLPSHPTSRLIHNNIATLSSYDHLALGPSSWGFIAGWQYMNATDIRRYIQANHDSVTNHISCACKLTQEDLIERNLVQGLSRNLWIAKDLLGKVAQNERYKAILQKLKEHGLLIENEERYVLTKEANGYVFNIAQEFISRENRKKIFLFFLRHLHKHKKKEINDESQ